MVRFPVLEGDKVRKEVDTGGYRFHPVPPLNYKIKETIRTIYESSILMIETSSTLGYTTSGGP